MEDSIKQPVDERKLYLVNSPHPDFFFGDPSMPKPKKKKIKTLTQMPMLQKVTSNKANVMDDSHPKQSIDKQPHESTSKETKSAKKIFQIPDLSKAPAFSSGPSSLERWTQYRNQESKKKETLGGISASMDLPLPISTPQRPLDASNKGKERYLDKENAENIVETPKKRKKFRSPPIFLAPGSGKLKANTIFLG